MFELLYFTFITEPVNNSMCDQPGMFELLYFTLITEPVNNSMCDQPGMFECHPGFCISQDLVCNGIPDCLTDKDETDCGKTI